MARSESTGNDPGEHQARGGGFCRAWGWVSSALGLAVIVVTYVGDVITYRWIEAQDLVPDINNPTDYALGIIGVALIGGGLAAVVSAHHGIVRHEQRPRSQR